MHVGFSIRTRIYEFEIAIKDFVARIKTVSSQFNTPSFVILNRAVKYTIRTLSCQGYLCKVFAVDTSISLNEII
jgi:hypothetical protein